MDDPRLAKTAFHARLEIRRHQLADVTRSKRVQIQHPINRQFHRLFHIGNYTTIVVPRKLHLLPVRPLLECRIKIKIRPARSSDASAISAFNVRLAEESEGLRLDPARTAAGVKALLENPTKGAYFMAEAEENSSLKLVGQLLITTEWSDWRNGTFWWVQSVYVIDEFRGQGVFRSLYAHVRDLAKSRPDICGLRLYVDAGNARARNTYERLGMKKTNYEIFEEDFVLQHAPAHS